VPEASEVRDGRVDVDVLADVDKEPQKRRSIIWENDARHRPASADLSCHGFRWKVNPDRSNELYDSEIRRKRVIM
jgi:hypothetical protein